MDIGLIQAVDEADSFPTPKKTAKAACFFSPSSIDLRPVGGKLAADKIT